MSAIAHITDSKMLEHHRLNANKTMNFWRLSTKTSFSDFMPGDLVFFLSKDKEQMNKKEKGIVGYGKLETINVNSVKAMWDKYSSKNGYNSLDEFKQAIIKVSKDKKLPKKISSLYLTNVNFFSPIYLSECGMDISSNIESYVYLKKDEVGFKLLELASKNMDLWSNLNNDSSIEEDKITYALFATHHKIQDIKLTDKLTKRAYKYLKNYQAEHPKYHFIQDSKTELYKLEDNELTICFYVDKDIDPRLIIGQAILYKKEMAEYLPMLHLEFKTNNQKLNDLINN